MTNEDQRRIQENNRYYDRFAEQVRQRTEKRSYERAFATFRQYADKGKPVLDIGCGTGLHMKVLQAAGYEVLGIEPSAKMRAIAVEEGLNVLDGTFETLPLLSLPEIGGVWCAASLLHVRESNLLSVLQSIHVLLAEKGILYLTVRLGEGSAWDRYDEQEGSDQRFIQLFSKEQLLDALDKSSFLPVEEWTEESTWGRSALWISLLAVKTGALSAP